MDWIRTLLAHCAMIFLRRRLDADLDEELRAHIDLAIHDYLRGGLPPQQARIAALRAFGGVTQTRESYREQRGFPLVQQSGRDLRFAIRQLRKFPRLCAHSDPHPCAGYRSNRRDVQRN